MLFATFFANALLLLTSFGTNILVNAPRNAETVNTFPPLVALVSEEVDPLIAWRIVTPLIDQPSLRMVLVAEKPFIEQELIAPFINVTPTLSTCTRSPIASCSAADRFSLCASVDVTENQNTNNIFVIAPRIAEAAFTFPPPVALVSEDVDLLAVWRNATPVVDRDSVAENQNTTQFLQLWQMITALAATCGRGLVIARDVMYSLVETLVAALNRFLDVLLSLFPSEYVEAAVSEFPYWGLFLFWFYFVTCLYLPLVSVLVSVSQITSNGHKTWKRLLLQLDNRLALGALTPPSCKHVQFRSEETSPVLSVHEYPRAFETVEDKARLYWTFEEMKHCMLEYKAELKFRAKLKFVLGQKQEDQQRREA